MLERESQSILYWTGFFEIREYFDITDEFLEKLHAEYSASALTFSGFIEVLREKELPEKSIADLNKPQIRFYRIQIEQFDEFFEHEIERVRDIIETADFKQKTTVTPFSGGKLLYMEIRSGLKRFEDYFEG